MTVKEFLVYGRKLNEEVEQLKCARVKAFDLACGTTVGNGDEKVQTSKINSTESRFAAYADYSKILDEKIDELMNYRKDVLRLIYKLDNTTYRTLLVERYINCKTWEEIAEDMGYSEVWVRTGLHGKALAEAGKYF